jgi:Holliday junction resolvase-like predicted endonuclease
MKRVQIVLLGLLLLLGVNATAQRRQNLAPELRQRMGELQLTAEQKRKIAIIIRRQRMQNLANQQELNGILTEKQKLLLRRWKENRFKSNDSTDVKP